MPDPTYIYGTESYDDLYGTAGDDVIFGLGASDDIYAGAGDDQIFGGDGRERIYDGAGNDTCDGGQDNGSFYADISDPNGNDIYVADPRQGGITRLVYQEDTNNHYAILTTALTVDLAEGYARGEAIGHDVFQGITEVATGNGDDRIIGSDFIGPRTEQYWDEVFRANGGQDRIVAKGGRDWVNAGAGDDVVLGGEGNDALHGSDGSDRLYGGSGNDGITDDYDDNPGAPGHNDVLCGGEGNDGLMSFADNDILMGGEGDDRLTTAGARTRMYGGEGADTFRFGIDEELAAGRKVIYDFEDGIDKLEFHIYAYERDAILATARDTRVGDAVILDLTADAQVVIRSLTVATLDLSDFVI